MPDPIQLIPVDAIDEAALSRDRTASDDEARTELASSISRTGLRMPIEVWQLSEPRGPHRYGLISGFRRLAAFRELHGMARDKTRFAAIPAFIREPASIAEALAAMVEENAVRAGISPWEQAKVAVTARDEGVFPSVEEAIDALYASYSRDKRKRLRALAHLAEDLDGTLTAPETLSQRQLMRLAGAVTRGYGPLIHHALGQSSLKDAATQWRILVPILAESETSDPIEPEPLMPDAPARRPRRLLYPRRGVHIRRERTRDGWCLHITGPEATGMFMDGVLDEVERWCGPA